MDISSTITHACHPVQMTIMQTLTAFASNVNTHVRDVRLVLAIVCLVQISIYWREAVILSARMDIMKIISSFFARSVIQDVKYAIKVAITVLNVLKAIFCLKVNAFLVVQNSFMVTPKCVKHVMDFVMHASIKLIASSVNLISFRMANVSGLLNAQKVHMQIFPP